MTEIEIKVNELIVESIDKLIEKYQKKADKERAKVNQAYVTYKGEKYYSLTELMDAYSCDAFSSATYDGLIEKLEKKTGDVPDAMTDSEQIVYLLNKHKSNLLLEVSHERLIKQRQAEVDERMKQLISEGYSFREAETIIGNEELMRFE